MKAMLKFPTRFTFNVVGKTGGDEKVGEDYVENVKKAILRVCDGGDGEIQCQTIPRGKNFIKVQCEVEVGSSSMINSIYGELDELEATVMKF